MEDLCSRNKILEDKTKEWKAKLLTNEPVHRPLKKLITPAASGDFEKEETATKKIFDLEKENEYLKVSLKIY